MPDKLITYCSAGGIVVDGERVLLVRKKRVDEVRLPKGHVEPGERREAAALRETTEETGYASLRLVADLGILAVEFARKGEQVLRFESFFLMALDGPDKIRRTEEDRAKFKPFWGLLAETEAMLTFPSEQEFFRRAMARLTVPTSQK